MTITYATRTAVQQSIITLKIKSRQQMPSNFDQGSFCSTYGRHMELQQEYNTAPADGAAVDFSNGVNIITVDRSAMDNTFSNFGIVAIGDDIFSLSASSELAGVLTLDCAKTSMPTSGATVETRYAPTCAMPSSLYTQNVPPMPILDASGIMRAMVAYDATLGSGQTYIVNTTLMTLTTEQKFEGLDAQTAGNSTMGWKPKDDGTGNFGLWSGVYLGTNTRPILIDANLDGTENGRYNIHLSDLSWDGVLNQPVADAGMRQILPCNAGWFAAWGNNVVTPPSFVIFNEDMTKYWIYVIQSDDADTNQAIFVPGFWGETFSERIWMDAPPLTDQGTLGAVQITGAVGNPSLLMENSGEIDLSFLLTDNYPTIVSSKCVPCAPLQIGPGDTWKPRNA